MERAQNLRPWPKGVSGNPGGRPKSDLAAEVARLVFEGLDQKQAAKVLAKVILRNPKMFQVIADRAYDKVLQNLNVTAETNLSMKIVERLEAARKRGDGSGR
jgi:hypothetical protein